MKRLKLDRAVKADGRVEAQAVVEALDPVAHVGSGVRDARLSLAPSARDVDTRLAAPDKQASVLAFVPLVRGVTTGHIARAVHRLHDLGSTDSPDAAT